MQGMVHLTPLIAALTVDLSQLGDADGEAPRVIKLLPVGYSLLAMIVQPTA